MASLLILKGNNQGQTLELLDDKIVLGRNPDCHVVINGTAVSRAHAHILRIEGKYWIEDQNSRNGTFINNEAIGGRTQLKDNDRIKICDFLCTFHDVPEVKPLPEELLPEEPEPAEEESGPSTVEAAVSHISSKLLLETQPAEKLKTLLEICNNLCKTLELDSLLPKIADNLFQLFKQADRCFIIMRDETGKRLMPKVIRMRRVQDETKTSFSRRIVNQCMDNLQFILSDDAATDNRFGMSQSIADFRIRSVMCAPLVTQDNKPMGVIQLDTQDRSKKFTQEDLNLLSGVAGQASIALENATFYKNQVVQERIKRDLELAHEVQKSFLPKAAPSVAGYEFFDFYDAAQEVGGDYYDFIPLPQGRLAIMLGDVAGKGVPAALLMAKFSADARFCMLTEASPAAAITRLNSQLSQAGLMDRFVTLAAAVLNPADHSVTLVNAGHPSPLIYRKATGSVEEATPNAVAGLPIGVADGFEYESCQVQLQMGDCLVVFSDGVPDAMSVNDKPFQIQGVYKALQSGPHSAKTFGDRLVRMVKQHTLGRASPHDDITLVAFGRTSESTVTQLPPAAAAMQS